MELLYEILETVNKDQDLNSTNVVEKIKEEFERKENELFKKRWDKNDSSAARKYRLCSKKYKEWKGSGFSLNHDFNEGGILLRIAAKNGYINVLKAMIGDGANVDGNIKYTPLHEAVEDGRIEMINFLLESGADINAKMKTSEEKTPLYIAVDRACYNYKEGKFDNYKKYLEIIKLLIAKKADINVSDPLGCALGNINLVKLLVDNGARVHGRHLHGAANGCKIEIVKFLIDNGADIHFTDSRGNTPLHGAVMCSKTNTIKLLIEKGAKVNARNESGETPLYEAIYHNRVEIAEVLIDNSADVNVRDSQGNTPLHKAAVFSNTGTIEFLLKKGAKANIQDNYGRTPLHWIVLKYRHERDVLILVKNGADSFIRDNNYKTPIDYRLEQQQEMQFFSDWEKRWGFGRDSNLDEPVFLIKLQQAYNKDLIVRYSTMLLGAVVACTLFTTGNVTSDVPHIVGAVAVVTAAAYAMGRITYEIFKPSTTMEEVEQEPPAGQYQSLR